MQFTAEFALSDCAPTVRVGALSCSARLCSHHVGVKRPTGSARRRPYEGNCIVTAYLASRKTDRRLRVAPIALNRGVDSVRGRLVLPLPNAARYGSRTRPR